MNCGHALVAEPIYLRSNPPFMKREIIGRVGYCHKCERQAGDVRGLYGAPRKVTAEAWLRMRGRKPPFVFVDANGSLLPEIAGKVEDVPAPQELAANEPEDYE